MLEKIASADVLVWFLYSPAAALPVCLLLFVLQRRAEQKKFSDSFLNFMVAVVVGSGCVFMLVALWVMWLSAKANSGNGPLMLIFLGPAAISLGAVLGGGVSVIRARRSQP